MIHSKPIIGIPVDVKTIDNAPYHVVGEKYINAIGHATGCMPVLLPSMGDGSDMKSVKHLYSVSDVCDSVDGIFLPGSYSNIHPKHYGKPMKCPFCLMTHNEMTSLWNSFISASKTRFPYSLPAVVSRK